ncbi:MAG TPA: hypothetical protein VKT22_13020 [Steroidobacteraceae bacterium]|nr:hypothetical protein [Steroidobacteraceae bacterium]
MNAQGKWNIVIRTPAGERAGVLDLKVEGDRFTGSLSDAEYYAPINDGRIEGNRLRWSARITKPMKMNFKFTATVEADRIEGSAHHLLISARFSGSRVA